MNLVDDLVSIAHSIVPEELVLNNGATSIINRVRPCKRNRSSSRCNPLRLAWLLRIYASIGLHHRRVCASTVEVKRTMSEAVESTCGDGKSV